MNTIAAILEKHQSEYHRVVDFNPPKDKLYHFDLTASNAELREADLTDTQRFSGYIDQKLKSTKSRYGIGGYGENRPLYRRSILFEGEEPRTIHLGVDIWGPAGTSVYAALGGVVHSFAFNNNFGDYGATIILQHQLETKVFCTLYGHLALKDLAQVKEGKYISRGELIGHFGEPAENGNWPSHLHFQVIEDMRVKKGDYPGVCSVSESEKYLANCPDPDLVLGMMKYVS
jgi:murein DD-endopeptidase MepM/ murein hydrolase activator NlpD